MQATNSRYLNDASEVRFALDLIRKELRKRRKSVNVLSKEGIFYKNLTNRIGYVDEIQIFVLSFSQNGNTLSQWRAYCRDGGYSLGFNYTDLKTYPAPSFLLYRCIYNKQEQIELFNSILDEFVQGISTLSVKEIQAKVTSCLIRLLIVAPLLKDSSFSEEEEWRLISSWKKGDNKIIEYRKKRNMLVPFYPCPLQYKGGTINIEEIIVGPHPNQKLALDSVWNFLLKAQVGIKCKDLSKIPYREL